MISRCHSWHHCAAIRGIIAVSFAALSASLMSGILPYKASKTLPTG